METLRPLLGQRSAEPVGVSEGPDSRPFPPASPGSASHLCTPRSS